MLRQQRLPAETASVEPTTRELTGLAHREYPSFLIGALLLGGPWIHLLYFEPSKAENEFNQQKKTT